MSNILAGAYEFDKAREAKAKSIKLEDVLKQIKSHTFGCMVAGGYCRDVFHGVAHKDIDIVIYNFHSGDAAEVNLMNMLWKWMQDSLSAYNITETSGPYEGDKRIEFVWHLPHHNADIICWNARTHTEVLNKFDCNLNQFYLPSTVPDFESDKPYEPSLDESPVYVGDDSPDSLVFLKELTDERIEKMENKHKLMYPEAWSGTSKPVWYYESNDDCDFTGIAL